MKKSVLIIFDDDSAGAAALITENLNSDNYEIITIGITKKGRWLLYPGSVANITESAWEQDGDCVCAVLSPDKLHGGVIKIEGDAVYKKIDVAFPLVRDKGALQGLLHLSGIPYIGSDIASTVTCSDNALTHAILEYSGINTAKWKIITERKISELDSECDKISQNLDFPLYIKPANSKGGCTKANDIDSLKESIKIAFSYDNKIIIEEYITGRELQVAVFGNEHLVASFVHDKNDSSSSLPDDIANQIRNIAKRAYKTLGCKGFALVNIFYTGNKILIDEVDTLPDLSRDGAVAKLLGEVGMEYSYILEKLIKLTISA